MDKTIFNENQNTVIIAHRKEDVIKLFRKIKLAYDKMPPEVKPSTKYDTKNELYFDQINSRIEVALTNRGDTINNLHVSELAFIRDADEKMLATLQAVPQNGIIFFESTPNGIGNYYHNIWTGAEKKENDYKTHFFPWFNDPAYKSAHEITLHDSDIELGEKYGLSKNQLYWRRSKIREIGSERDFKQEYPEDPHTCFLTSGNPVFHVEKLDQIQSRCTPPLRGSVVLDEFIENKQGVFYVWEKPGDRYEEYVIGADVAEGGKSDYSCAIVLKRSPLKVVGKIYGRFDPDIFGDYIIAMSKLYNDAFTGVEINGPGLVTCIKLEKSEHHIPAYKSKAYDNFLQKETERIGWRTTGQTKPMIIENLVAAVRDDDIIIPDKQIIAECFTYERDARGRTNAPKGCNDDHVMALAIALQMHTESGPILTRNEKIKLDAEQFKAQQIRNRILKNIKENQVNKSKDPHLGSDF